MTHQCRLVATDDPHVFACTCGIRLHVPDPEALKRAAEAARARNG